MRFDLEAAPRYWHSDSPFLTHYFTSMSLLFPGGEKFFIDSVGNFEAEITDPLLREQVKAFTAQESQHTHQHRLYDRLMTRNGVPVQRYEGWIESVLQLARRWLPLKAQLAVTIALEHFTAVFANQLLSEPRFTEGMHPSVRPLWLWHAVEETEHKAVCYDVYHAILWGCCKVVPIASRQPLGGACERHRGATTTGKVNRQRTTKGVPLLRMDPRFESIDASQDRTP